MNANQKSNHTPTWASILTKNEGGVGTECKRETVLEVWNGGDKAFERPIAEVLVAIREHEALNRVAEAAKALEKAQISYGDSTEFVGDKFRDVGLAMASLQASIKALAAIREEAK